MAERLLRKGKCSICSQRRLDSVEARQLPGKWNGGVWRIQLERSPQAPVPATHSQRAAASRTVPVPVGAADPRAHCPWLRPPGWQISLPGGKEKPLPKPETAILAASPQVGTLSAPRTHCEVLNKLLATHV